MNLGPLIELLAEIAAERMLSQVDTSPRDEHHPQPDQESTDARRHLRAVQHGTAVSVVD